MAQDYERKDNKSKMCFKGDWTKNHHVKDLLLTFVLLSSFSIFGAPFFCWDSFPFFFLLVLLFLLAFVFLACAFLVFAHFRFQ